MTEAVHATALDSVFTITEGTPIMAPPTDAAIDQFKMRDHPFIWALDAYVFAGPDAHRATELYAQDGWRPGELDVYVFQILSTTENVMTLRRVL